MPYLESVRTRQGGCAASQPYLSGLAGWPCRNAVAVGKNCHAHSHHQLVRQLKLQLAGDTAAPTWGRFTVASARAREKHGPLILWHGG